MLLQRQDSSSSSSSSSSSPPAPPLFDFTSDPDFSSYISDLSSELADDSFMSAPHFQYQDPYSLWSSSNGPILLGQGQLFSDHAAGSSRVSREWQSYNDGSFHVNAVNASPQPKLRPHGRALSNSTATSYASTSSPRQYPIAYENAFLDPNTYSGYHQSYHQSHHYPTPTQTPTQDSFMDQSNTRQGRTASSVERATAAHRVMKNIVTASDSSQQQQQQPTQYYSNEYLATPKTTNGDYSEMQPANGAPFAMRNLPNLERSLSEIYQDELYDPESNAVLPPAHPQQLSNASMLSPHRSVMSNRLQAANDARTSDPPVHIKRDTSPFRPQSPYASVHGYGPVQLGGLGTAAGQRQLLKAEADRQAFRQHHLVPDQSTPKTISPQEAYLDHFHDPAEEPVSGPPLFPHSSTSHQRLYDGNIHRPAYGPLNEESRMPTSVFNFQSPSVPVGIQSQPTSGFKFDPHQHRTSGESNEEPPADFPAHLVSMETSKSEAELESSQEADVARPAGRIADGGTYTCTYQNCTRRFATPALLQKHKREGHRSTAGVSAKVDPGTPTERATSSASPPKNTQAGPHRCERINPSTGKPCTTIFSRPYDLTRHEDTIHARRGKVQCQYCTEEKTFSRADALTRHMRVVHPTIDFPGKHRRRNID